MASKKPFFLFTLLSFISLVIHGQGSISKKKPTDSLSIRYDSLKAVVVAAPLRPHLKGDTLEFNTESMRHRPNAVVQDMLRRLPGLHIESDGTITYNGEKIQRLLVDGQDVFGKDPMLVVRSLDADKISRVQILDRKTEQSLFSGIDDGTRIKTLNLAIRENAKNGYSGRVEAGGNVEGNYTTSGTAAGFRRQEQYNAIGLSGNTGVLNDNDNGINSAASISFVSGTVDPLGASAGEGIPRTTGIALHYANQMADHASNLATNYQFGHVWTNPVTTIQSVQTQPGSIFEQRQENHSINKTDQHMLDARYEFKVASRSRVQLYFQGVYGQYQNQLQATTASSSNDTLLNNGFRSVHDNVANRSFDGDASWRIELGSQNNKILSFNIGVSKSEITTSGYLHSLDRFFEPGGVVLNMDTVDQREQWAEKSRIARIAVSYTQPIFPGVNLGFGYRLTIGHTEKAQATYANEDGKYSEVVDSLTNDLRIQTANHHMDATVQGKTKHLKYSFGVAWDNYFYQQRGQEDNSLRHLYNANVVPRLLVNYLLHNSIDIRFNYQSWVQQPSVSQMAQTKNNSNPLYLTIGNPDLQPITNHFLTASFRWLKPWMVYTAFNLRSSSNSFSTRVTTDSLGRQVSQPTNAGGGRSIGADIFVNHVMAGVNWGIHATSVYTIAMNFVNADLNRNSVFISGGGVNATKYVADKYSFQIETDVRYFYSRNSVNKAYPLHYWTQSYLATINLFLIPHYELGTGATYSWQQKTSTFSENTSALLWNTHVSRNFLHDKLKVKIQLNNIFDQNAGVSRVNSGNVNTQTATNILGRYWMLSVMYHFEKKFKNK